jgi:hypothetical protein
MMRKVKFLTRPSLTIEDIKQPDGSFIAGRRVWNAVIFITTEIDMFSHLKGDITLGEDGPDGLVAWRFHDAHVAPLDKASEHKFVIVFSDLVRL